MSGSPATPGAIVGLAGVLIWTEADRFEAMARFYRDTLGMTPRSSRADFVNFDWNGVRLSVSIHDRVRGGSRDPLRVMVNLRVDDIHAVHARLAGAGVQFTRPPEREDWGGWVATCADPDGNTVQLMQLPDGGPFLPGASTAGPASAWR
jgi:predicted enzyme related to lactoylglutathione lyase